MPVEQLRNGQASKSPFGLTHFAILSLRTW